MLIDSLGIVGGSLRGLKIPKRSIVWGEPNKPVMNHASTIHNLAGIVSVQSTGANVMLLLDTGEMRVYGGNNYDQRMVPGGTNFLP